MRNLTKVNCLTWWNPGT